MAIDIRANVTCSLGTLISGSISDDYLQGSGLVKTRGSAEISALITPDVGTIVTFSYTKNGITRTIPRKLRVLSSFADPFRRTTKVELGCKLTYLSDLTEPLSWSAINDPQNRDLDPEDSKIVTFPLYASSAMRQCLAKLQLTATSVPLTNRFSIEKFDFSAGYVSVLSDLLVSESYFGYLNENEVLEVQSLNVEAGAGPVFTSSDIIDIGPINTGQLPGEAVIVRYSTLKLKVPEEIPPEGGGEAPGGIGGTPANPEEAEEQAIITQRINWEREETYSTPETFYVPYIDPDAETEEESRKVAVFTGAFSTITTTEYEVLKLYGPTQTRYSISNSDLVFLGSVDTLTYTLIGSVPSGFPTGVLLGTYLGLSAQQQSDFDANPESTLQTLFPAAEVPDYFTKDADKWVYTLNGWELNPPTYQERFDADPEAVLAEVWPDAEQYDRVSDGSDDWVYLSGTWTLNPPTLQERFEEDPNSVLNEVWPSPQLYEYVTESNGTPNPDKWIHVGSGQWYNERLPTAEELYEEKEVPVLRETYEYGPLISFASSIATQRLNNGWGFANESRTISKTTETFTYDSSGNQVGSVKNVYEDGVKVLASSQLTWADPEEAINYTSDYLGSYVLTQTIRNSTETQSDLGGAPYSKDITSTYLKWNLTQGGSMTIANRAEQADSIDDTLSIIIDIIESGLVHKGTTTTVQRKGISTSQERPPAAERKKAQYAKNTLSDEERQIPPDNLAKSDTNSTTGSNPTSQPDPTNGYRVEETAEITLALGSAAAERRIELSMPYAPDDTFTKGANGKYYSSPSNAAQKASTFGRVQNRLLLGNRNGMNLQVAPEKLPEAPFDPIYVKASGLTAHYRVNGTQWAFDSNGIVCSTDALFWAAVSGTGTFWFPVAPSVTTLPAEPAIVNGQMTPTSVVKPYNETVLVQATTRLSSTIIKYPYALGLLTVVPALVVTTGVTVVRTIPTVNITLTAHVPTLSGLQVPNGSLALTAHKPYAQNLKLGIPAIALGVSGLRPYINNLRLAIPLIQHTLAAQTPTITTTVKVDAITYTQSSVWSGSTAASNAIMTDQSFNNTGAATDIGNPAWIKMDLGGSTSIATVVVGTATDNIPGGWDKSYTQFKNIQYSQDDITWTTAVNTDAFASNGIYTFAVDFSARYIRIATTGNNYVAISEFYALAPGQSYP